MEGEIQMKFKVGDRVILLRDSKNYYCRDLKEGEQGIIIDMSGFQHPTIEGKDGRKTIINPTGFRLVKSWKQRFEVKR